MEFRVLGPVEVHNGGQRLNIGPARQRAVLAVLLLDLGHVVVTERLVGRVWGTDPPPSARNALHGHMTRLRAAIGARPDSGTRLARRAGGYVLEADPEQVDVTEFRRLVTAASASGADERAAELLGGALECWRGPALAGVASPWLDGMRDALESERRAAVLDLNDIGLRQGRHGPLAAELTELAEVYPEDQRLVGQLMLALYRSGRMADALWWFERTRRGLADELGADPEPRLQELHQQIMRGDRSLDWPGLAGHDDGPAGGGGGRRPVPRELPADVPAFTGRAAELAELDRLLAGHAEDGKPDTVVVSAVAGTAGVGKTALAVRWAHRAAAQFPDGQLYVNLRGYDPGQPVAAADALAGFLNSLGVQDQGIPAELAQRAALYRSLLAVRRILVVLDNASDVEQVRPLLPGAAGCRVVVTSRDALAGLVARDGARRLDLDLLPIADAVALLRAVIGARVDAEPEATQTLAERCARLPLALRVAAELAVAQPALPLADLAAELTDEQGRLELLHAGGDSRTAVRAVFSWSCSHLDLSAVQAFALLGLHPGPDLEPYAAAAIVGVTLPEARRVLALLAAAHLIAPSPTVPGRHAMHDLLRAYARDLADSREDEEAQRQAITRLLDHYLAVAATAMEILHPYKRLSKPAVPVSEAPAPLIADKDAARAWLDGQLGCLVAAALHACAHGWPDHVIRLADTLFRYLAYSRPSAEAVTLLSLALSAARSTGSRSAEINALNQLGGLLLTMNQFPEATRLLRSCLALAKEAGNRGAQGPALGNLGNIDLQQGRYRQAADYYAQSLALAREVGNSRVQAMSLAFLGECALRCCRYHEAIGYLEQSHAIAAEMGERLIESYILSHVGYCEIALANYPQATRHLRQGMALARQLHLRREEAYALGGLGKIQLARSHHSQAARLLQRAIVMYREAGSRYGEAEMLSSLGEVLLAAGRPEQARSEHAAALVLASQIGNRHGQGQAHSGLASCYDAAGDREQARSHWHEALAIFTSIGSDEADQVLSRLAAPAGSAGDP
jgi:DNA-binding SARP family transcriptional activator/Flp pilus assembly protein TadD